MNVSFIRGSCRSATSSIKAEENPLPISITPRGLIRRSTA